MRVWEPMTNWLAEFAVSVCEPRVMTGGEVTPPRFFGGGMPKVLVPITIAVALGARLIGVPETVIWGPPGTRVWEPMINWLAEFAVRVCEPTVMTGAAPGPFCGVRAIVLVPTTMAEPPGAKLTGVPKAVICGPPGMRVWLPITKLLAGFAVRICEPMVITEATPGLLGGVKAIVLVPTAISVAPGARLTGVPETVI
jgi:hypothetical protein